ncbi:hypothetical protein SASPL_125772 [Salvia splendens]|uniref:Carboxypeptidase n=1 Tax=Salvia splendens TaxID=180675 RepID=A0A8X8XJI9_SALSN|nr:hypothetical protein SASPL_125772 [Salvia splendens]
MPFFRWVFHVFVVIAIVKLQSLSCSSSSFSFNQQQLDRVLKLPGQNFNVSFAHYAGYITVNEETGRELFYWFFVAEDDPSSKPLVLWLNGSRYVAIFSLLCVNCGKQKRPGCSSIAYGLAEEIGPLHIVKDGKTLYLNPYSWNKVANILFVDSPVGVGFSYSNTSADLLSNGDKRTADDNLIFIEKWLERFPQYKGRELYLTGESYAGRLIILHFPI